MQGALWRAEPPKAVLESSARHAQLLSPPSSLSALCDTCTARSMQVRVPWHVVQVPHPARGCHAGEGGAGGEPHSVSPRWVLLGVHAVCASMAESAFQTIARGSGGCSVAAWRTPANPGLHILLCSVRASLSSFLLNVYHICFSFSLCPPSGTGMFVMVKGQFALRTVRVCARMEA